MNFSVVLIAKNEEKTLPRLLGSLKEFQEKGGEVLLLDTGSTDKTVEVATSFNCIVHEVGDKFVRVIENADEINAKFVKENEEPIVQNGDKLFDYSSARNYIADFASNDMIATPDCDEVYTKLDLKKVNELIASGVEQLEYNFVFSHDQYGNEAVKFMHSKFYNRKKLKWVGIIHEVLEGEAKRQFVDESVIKLEHYQNHDTNRSGYLKGLALDCFENPENPRNSHYFGRELLWTGRPHSAIAELIRCIEIHWWAAEKASSAMYIGDAYGQLNLPEDQLLSYNQAIYYDGSLREPFIKLARFYQHNNNYPLTAAYAAAAMEIPWQAYYANNMAHYTYEPHELLYWAKGWQGDIEAAKYHLNQALKYRPTDTNYLRDVRFYYSLPKVSIIIPTLGRPEGLKRCLDSITRLNYPQQLIEVITEPGEEETVPQKVAMGLERANGEYIAYAANDIEFDENSLILAVKDSLDTGKGLVAFDTGVRNDEGYINEHFIIRRDLIDKIGGEIFDTDFYHVGVDDLLWKKCAKLGEAMITKGKVEHYHYSRVQSGIKPDKIIEKGWANAEADRLLLKTKLKELENE